MDRVIGIHHLVESEFLPLIEILLRSTSLDIFIAEHFITGGVRAGDFQLQLSNILINKFLQAFCVENMIAPRQRQDFRVQLFKGAEANRTAELSFSLLGTGFLTLSYKILIL